MPIRKLLLIPLLILLVLRCYFHFTAPKPFKNGDRIRISTKVSSEPIVYDTAQYLNLIGLKVYLPLIPEISYGDRIVVEGTVDLDKLRYAKVVDHRPSTGILFRFRNRLLGFYNSSLPLPYSSLIAGVTIGSKSGIPADFWNSLKNSGTAHVVVASGMNISLVGGFLLSLFIVLMKRRYALILAIIGIWSYAILSGFDAPIVRSAIMGTIAFSSQVLGRLNLSLRALIVSGGLMIFINPGYISDAGFLLSFFATLGLILFQSKIEKKLKLVPLVVRQDLSTTLAAQIGVVPLLYYFFGQFNFLSPVANVLVLWTIVPITIVGMTGGIIGLFVPLVGKFLLLMSYPLMWWFVTMVNLFGGT